MKIWVVTSAGDVTAWSLREKAVENIVFDGMDTVYTAVIPVARVEQALEKVLELPPKSVTLDVIPASGEGKREDRTT